MNTKSNLGKIQTHQMILATLISLLILFLSLGFAVPGSAHATGFTFDEVVMSAAAAAPSPQIRGGVCGATIESSGTAAVCSEGGSGTPQPLPCDIGCWKPCKRWHFHDDGTVHCHGGGKN